jgi:hypothetical protein
MNDVDMCHVMVDIETLSTRSNGVILSIGAVQFDLKGHILNGFHEGVDINSCIKRGLHIDGDTVKWWLGQSKENIDRLLKLSCSSLEGALKAFEKCFSLMGKDSIYMWSHGSNFDLVVLENAYHAVDSKVWWKYSNVRDTRTLFDIANYKYIAKGGHDALEDAINQAQAVGEAYQQLKGGK